MSVPAYSFLSKPPPQKKRPVIPLPATPRSSTFTAIATWAAHVQPGSPGSPHSPRRRSSLSRRPSVSHTPSPRTPSHSFLIIETPSPASKEFSIDLTDLGYTSVFLHLPKTPSTPSHLQVKPLHAPVNPDHFPPPPSTKPLKRFRSLSILRSRNRSNTTALPPSPTKSTRTSKSKSKSKPKPSSPIKFETPQILAASVAKRKKAIYAYAAPAPSKPAKPSSNSKKATLPPSLAAELALMQFADGGSTEANIKRLMEAHASANAPAGTKGTQAGVGDVYRDGKGGIWWDREEEMEYIHLLGGHSTAQVGTEGVQKWVSFGGEVEEGKRLSEDDEEENDGALALASLAGVSSGRRDSATTTVSMTSSLDPANIVKPADEDAMLVRVPQPFETQVQKESQQPKRRATPEPILTIPSRPRSTHHHVQASPGFFILDLNTFNVPTTPRSALRIPKTPLTPSSPHAHPYAHAHAKSHTQSPRPTLHHMRTRSSPTRPTFPCAHSQKRRRGPARRRPAPLNIVAHVPMRGVSPDLDAEEDVLMKCDVEKAKKEFMDDSFEPIVVGTEASCGGVTAPLEFIPDKQRILKKKASKSLLGLFGRK